MEWDFPRFLFIPLVSMMQFTSSSIFLISIDDLITKDIRCFFLHVLFLFVCLLKWNNYKQTEEENKAGDKKEEKKERQREGKDLSKQRKKGSVKWINIETKLSTIQQEHGRRNPTKQLERSFECLLQDWSRLYGWLQEPVGVNMNLYVYCVLFTVSFNVLKHFPTVSGLSYRCFTAVFTQCFSIWTEAPLLSFLFHC